MSISPSKGTAAASGGHRALDADCAKRVYNLFLLARSEALAARLSSTESESQRNLAKRLGVLDPNWTLKEKIGS
jgi:hypothetical protein